jgi:hypothetical protein
MAATINVTFSGVDQTLNKFVVEGTIVLTGNYGGAATHGDTLSFAGFDLIKSNSVPAWVQIQEAPPAGTAPTGYQFGFAPGTTQANGVLTIFTGTTEYTEASPYSAGLLAAVLQFRAEFPAFI